ncbi:hypothetical protein HMPREF3223_01827 [Cutibacterium avidum]|nr:hypothetical protein HMPREF3223_01827 [Cutibacterium avidum]
MFTHESLVHSRHRPRAVTMKKKWIRHLNANATTPATRGGARWK